MANLLITKENLDLDNSFKVEGNKVKLHENVSAEVAKSIDITAKLEPITQKIEEVNSTIRVSVADVKREVETVNSTVLATKREVDTLTITVGAVKDKVDNLSELETQKDQLVALSPKVDALEQKVQAVESVTVTARDNVNRLDKLEQFTVSKVSDVNATLNQVALDGLTTQVALHKALDNKHELQDLAGNSLGYLLDKATVDSLFQTRGDYGIPKSIQGVQFAVEEHNNVHYLHRGSDVHIGALNTDTERQKAKFKQEFEDFRVDPNWNTPVEEDEDEE